MTLEEQYLDLFLHPAWVNLRDSLESDLTVLNNLDSLSSVDELFYRKGQMSVIRDILSMEQRYRENTN
jgi:hypothetical protein